MVAAKKKATTKRVTKAKDPAKLIPIPVVMPDTVEGMLKYLNATYAFGADIASKIEALTYVSPNPLDRIPSALKQAIDDSRARAGMIEKLEVKKGEAGTYDQLTIPAINGHEVIVRFFNPRSSQAGKVRFIWGCRSYWEERFAREHWKNNISLHSNKPRSHATELMDLVRDLAKFRGNVW